MSSLIKKRDDLIHCGKFTSTGKLNNIAMSGHWQFKLEHLVVRQEGER